MNKIFIYNNNPSHYEIIESTIHRFCDISNSRIVLAIKNNCEFVKYIYDKYPRIQLLSLDGLRDNVVIHPNNIDSFDKIINCSTYDFHYNDIHLLHHSKYVFVCHEITERLKKMTNTFFLTPLCGVSRYFYAPKLPGAHTKLDGDIAIFAVQGNFDDKRRNYNLLASILSCNFDYPYRIKLIGRGNMPAQLVKYSKRIHLCSNLNFIDYHKEFLACYGILTLTDSANQSQYYSNKLTSSINYAKAYDLKCVIDKELQSIYQLKGAYVYDEGDDIVKAFSKSLTDFYIKS